MGLKEAISNAVSWIVDTILRPVVTWIGTQIQWVIGELKYWKHRAFEMLATWLENDWFFIGVVIGTIALAIGWSQIVAYVKTSSIFAWLKSLWVTVKQGLASVLDFIHILDLITINNILKILWPEWRNLMGQLSNVVSALAEELGQGSGYIHAYFSVVHSLAYLQHSFLGTDPRLGEMQAFEDTSKYLQTINDRFRTYAHDPGQLTRDIIDDLYIPYSTVIRDAQQDELDQIRANRDRVIEVNGAIEDLAGSLDNFIAVQPEETATIIEERIGPFAEKLLEITDIVNSTVMPMVNGIIAELEYRAEAQDQINRRIIGDLEDPYSLLANYEKYDFESKEDFERYIAEITGKGREEAEEAIAEGFRVAGEGLLVGIEAAYVPPPVIAPPEIEPTRYEAPGHPPAGTIPGWFQGEY